MAIAVINESSTYFGVADTTFTMTDIIVVRQGAGV